MRKNRISLSLIGLTLMVLMVSSVFACEPPETGKITGGGHGKIGENGIPGGSFGFNVMWFSKDPAPKGELEYVDHDTGMNVHAHSIEYLEVWEELIGNKPWPLRKGIFGGPCTIDGESGFTFDVYIEDNGEPGKNDVFKITLSTGYIGGSDIEPILCGNIQIHKPPK
ncbi:MAG: post-COAP-1 domain-containing protein [Promethearchaeota archaeon]